MVVLILSFHPFSNMVSSVDSFFFHDNVDTQLSLNIANMTLMSYLIKGWLFKRGGVRCTEILVERNRVVKQGLQTSKERKGDDCGFLVEQEAIISSSIQHGSHFQVYRLCVFTISLKRDKSPKHSPDILRRERVHQVFGGVTVDT